LVPRTSPSWFDDIAPSTASLRYRRRREDAEAMGLHNGAVVFFGEMKNMPQWKKIRKGKYANYSASNFLLSFC